MGIRTTTTWGNTLAAKAAGLPDGIKDALREIEIVHWDDLQHAKGEGRGNRLTSAPRGRVTSVPTSDEGAADEARDIAAERDEAREAATEIESERDRAIEALTAAEGAVDALTDVVERLLAEFAELWRKHDEACDDVTRLEEELDAARAALQEVRNG